MRRNYLRRVTQGLASLGSKLEIVKAFAILLTKSDSRLAGDQLQRRFVAAGRGT